MAVVAVVVITVECAGVVSGAGRCDRRSFFVVAGVVVVVVAP